LAEAASDCLLHRVTLTPASRDRYPLRYPAICIIPAFCSESEGLTAVSAF